MNTIRHKNGAFFSIQFFIKKIREQKSLERAEKKLSYPINIQLCVSYSSNQRVASELSSICLTFCA